jgi:hypothetical protein
MVAYGRPDTRDPAPKKKEAPPERGFDSLEASTYYERQAFGRYFALMSDAVVATRPAEGEAEPWAAL